MKHPGKLKENILRHEKYHRQALLVRKDHLPETMPHIIDGMPIVRMEIMAAGIVTLGKDPEKLEFQDIRIYCKRLPL